MNHANTQLVPAETLALPMSCYVPSEDMILRFRKSHIKPSEPRTASHGEVVARVEACRVNTNQYIVLRDHRLINFLEFEDIRSSVPLHSSNPG
jgi:hypothetical protein